ncbi:hypothetical protein BOQ62_11970 [Chryseobacterium sp. CH21]|uniref:hypothetical protein n=1 Tax=Chryseobacterium sp. CH21 TaxID=713556 RepID=UPI00100B6065|nr:hypothetical protein [Chryseobacterium sp. CH21]RXM39385.1 hypothetical protein BOQ62_11970 [Chryseobacterium sp. CH21]
MKYPKLFFIFSMVHIALILIVCTSSTIDSYEKSTSYVENDLTAVLKDTKEGIREFNSISLIQQYQAIAGINAGYGFFAPNVASSYILKISVYDKNRNLVKESYFPPFKSKEGLNRYHTLLGYFQDRLTILENKMQKKNLQNLMNLTNTVNSLIYSSKVSEDIIIRNIILIPTPFLVHFICTTTQCCRK